MADKPNAHMTRPSDAHVTGSSDAHVTGLSDGLVLTLLLGAAVVGAAVGAWGLGPLARWLLDVLPVVPFRLALRFLGAIDVWWEMLLAGAAGALVLLVVTLGALEKRGVA
ncbi:YqeB family protein [Streptomyces sp. P6-2-1]|uniref:YqeB family protein n=1 Tax=unclassified Streptomyces TaxID=2593676 RepID=UPI003D36F90F